MMRKKKNKLLPLIILSDENGTPVVPTFSGMQKIEVKPSVSAWDAEQVHIWFSIGSEKDFELGKEQSIQLIDDEVKQLYDYLGQFYHSISKETVIQRLDEFVETFKHQLDIDLDA